MSLALNSVRTMGHVSILRNAPALFIGVSRLHRTTLFQQSLRVFPTFTQKETSKAMIAAPKPVIPAVAPRAVSPVFVSKLIDPETRQRHRIKRMAAQQIYQQNAKRLSVTIYNAGPTLYLGHFGSNYYDYDSEDSEQSDSNQYEWILRACFHGFWSALFTVVYEIARGRYVPLLFLDTFQSADMRGKKVTLETNNENVFRPLGEGAWEDEEEWDDNDEIRELEEENDELRDEIGRLRRENSKLKGQSGEFVCFPFYFKEGMVMLSGFANEMV
ncbi:hypothetical protein COCC4DRAFT_23306 [Bipolaris maydis ATCC 48331]|uniref:Uncharacterized protein n=1 Tax=Cochliobolus heterostrophus (strain C4 / ATCC 48331 / race T) TaxID=665024 RepID=N4XAL5_COCH4|nr:uncharacterized protein COCC4DRAFT_23306 [Bipolaris maydis ATCC 48331]ENI05553.1 hypothetical protein COCC4DRAFT_23306 [Bipolaris maydis ATCC 48331]KAH7556623.1 hypothetical protein BM1_06057 [Bipolaris maydis]